jgi:hypothetical protein
MSVEILGSPPNKNKYKKWAKGTKIVTIPAAASYSFTINTATNFIASELYIEAPQINTLSNGLIRGTIKSGGALTGIVNNVQGATVNATYNSGTKDISVTITGGAYNLQGGSNQTFTWFVAE